MTLCMKVVTFAILLVLLLPVPSTAQNTRVPWSAFTMGYGTSHEGNTAVKAAVGQTIVGQTRGANFQTIGGFLANPLLSNLVTGVEQSEEGLPAVFGLAQNYPNPFNPTTTIHFDLPVKSHVSLKVFNVIGQEVVTLVDEEKTPGRHSVRLNAAALASGAYFYRLVAGSFVAVKKLLLLR